jgi:hypothetical protein
MKDFAPDEGLAAGDPNLVRTQTDECRTEAI